MEGDRLDGVLRACVLDHVDPLDRSTLASLSLVSTAWRQSTCPLLFRAIRISPVGERWQESSSAKLPSAVLSHLRELTISDAPARRPVDEIIDILGLVMDCPKLSSIHIQCSQSLEQPHNAKQYAVLDGLKMPAVTELNISIQGDCPLALLRSLLATVPGLQRLACTCRGLVASHNREGPSVPTLRHLVALNFDVPQSHDTESALHLVFDTATLSQVKDLTAYAQQLLDAQQADGSVFVNLEKLRLLEDGEEDEVGEMIGRIARACPRLRHLHMSARYHVNRSVGEMCAQLGASVETFYIGQIARFFAEQSTEVPASALKGKALKKFNLAVDYDFAFHGGLEAMGRMQARRDGEDSGSEDDGNEDEDADGDEAEDEDEDEHHPDFDSEEWQEKDDSMTEVLTRALAAHDVEFLKYGV